MFKYIVVVVFSFPFIKNEETLMFFLYNTTILSYSFVCRVGTDNPSEFPIKIKQVVNDSIPFFLLHKPPIDNCLLFDLT